MATVQRWTRCIADAQLILTRLRPSSRKKLGRCLTVHPSRTVLGTFMQNFFAGKSSKFWGDFTKGLMAVQYLCAHARTGKLLYTASSVDAASCTGRTDTARTATRGLRTLPMSTRGPFCPSPPTTRGTLEDDYRAPRPGHERRRKPSIRTSTARPRPRRQGRGARRRKRTSRACAPSPPTARGAQGIR